MFEFLAGLSLEYEHIRAHILNINLSSLYEVYVRVHKEEGRRRVMNLLSTVENQHLSSPVGDAKEVPFCKLIVVVFVFFWMIRIVLSVSIVIDLDMLWTSVGICMDAHRIFFHGSHNEVEAVTNLEVIDSVCAR